MPFPDDMQDIMLTSAMEMNGYTNLVFHRKRKTADTAKDVEIKVLHDIKLVHHTVYTEKRLFLYICIDIQIRLELLRSRLKQGLVVKGEMGRAGCRCP